MHAYKLLRCHPRCTYQITVHTCTTDCTTNTGMSEALMTTAIWQLPNPHNLMPPQLRQSIACNIIQCAQPLRLLLLPHTRFLSNLLHWPTSTASTPPVAAVSWLQPYMLSQSVPLPGPGMPMSGSMSGRPCPLPPPPPPGPGRGRWKSSGRQPSRPSGSFEREGIVTSSSAHTAHTEHKGT